MAKTREEYQAELVKLRETAESKTREYNDAFNAGKIDDYKDAEKAIDEAIEEYTKIAEFLAFDTCEKSADPMRAAVTMLTFQTIARKDSKDKETDVIIREINDKVKYIDLLKLHKRVKDGIGADKKWNFLVEKMNMCMTAQRASDLGYSADKLREINDSYAMSDIAKEFELGKNPCSNTQLLKTLNKVIAAMLGDSYKATSHDVVFLKTVYAKKGKAALAVSCANHSNFRKYVAEICHRIVTNGEYTVEYKRAK